MVPGPGHGSVEFEAKFEDVLHPCLSPGAVPPARGRHGCSFVKWGSVSAARGLRAAAPGSVAARDIISHTWAHERAPDADERSYKYAAHVSW